MLAGGVDDAHLLAFRKAPRYSFGMRATIIVFLGAGPDGVARYGLNVIVTWMMGTGFPFGILFVNLIGCFAMGVFAGSFALRGETGPSLRLFLMTGVLGGFTTFAAFALDTATLWVRNGPGPDALDVLLSVLGSLAALGAGLAVPGRGMTCPAVRPSRPDTAYLQP